MASQAIRQATDDGGDEQLQRLYHLLVTAANGETRYPKTEDEWHEWKTATAIDHARGKSLGYWLEVHGKGKSFCQDEDYSDFSATYDFFKHLREQGKAFEKSVVAWLAARKPLTRIASSGLAARHLEHAQQTVKAMLEGDAVIVHGILRNPDEQTYGVPDLLVRRDVIVELFPQVLNLVPPGALDFVAPNLRGPGYVVVDIKFSRWPIRAARDADLANDFELRDYLFNQALGRLQGFTPSVTFFIGRGPIESCLVSVDLTKFPKLGTEFAEASAWIDRVRRDGLGWDVYPQPSVPELWPNMKEPAPIGWRWAWREIAEKIRELTLLPYVAVHHRQRAHDAGIFRWDDPKLTPAVLGLSGKNAREVDAILEAHRSGTLYPAALESDASWSTPAPLEVFVSMQWVDDLSPEFPGKDLPQPPIAVAISWVSSADLGPDSLVAGELSLEAGQACLASFEAKLRTLAEAHGVALQAVRLVTWANTGPLPDTLQRLDMAAGIFERMPIGVPGALGCGLEEVTTELNRLGLIKATFTGPPSNGQEAAAAIWTAAKDAAGSKMRLDQTALMQRVVAYGEARVKAMREILGYLRSRAVGEGST